VIKRAIRRPYLVIVGAMLAAVLGFISYDRLPADLLPVFDTPAVQILTLYPGMPPEVVERDMTSRFERWTGQSVGISHQESKSMMGVSIVKDFFREDIDLATAMSQVSSYAMSDMFYQPPGTRPPMVMPFDPTAAEPLALVTVSSPKLNQKELYDVAYYELRNQLQSVEGVIAPAVYGGKLRQILSYVDREKLQARDLSLMDVVGAMQRQSPFLPTGNMRSGDTNYQIYANTMPKKIEELNEIPIATRDGETVYMSDVAKVEDAAAIQGNIVRINGSNQVYIPIYRQPGANTIKIVNELRATLDRIKSRLEEMQSKASSAVLKVVFDQSTYVRDALSGLQLAALLGAILAGLVVMVFLRRLRSTIIILLAIPLAIFMAFGGLWAANQTLNTLSLAGIALAIGILVDQSIVVVENIVRRRQAGDQPFEAARRGALEVGPSILVATITFAAVFFPIFLLSGMAEYLFTPLALAASFVMIASLIVAMTVVPAYCARFLGDVTDKPKNTGVGDFDDWRSTYGTVVRHALKQKWAIVVLALVATVGAGFLLMDTGQELYPRSDVGQFKMYVSLPSGTRIEKTEKVLAKVEKSVMEEVGRPDPTYPEEEKHPDSYLQMMITNIGVLMDWPAAYTPNAGPMDAFMKIDLKDEPGRPRVGPLVEKLRQKLPNEFPQAEFAFNTGGMLTTALNFGERAPIQFQVQGSDLDTLNELARIVHRKIDDVKGARDVRILQRMDYPVLRVNIDRKKAAKLGLTAKAIMENVVAATNSSVNFEKAFWIDPEGGNHYFMGAQYRKSQQADIDTLRDIPITPDKGKGEAVPLRQVAEIERDEGTNMVRHRDLTRVFDIYANVAPGAALGDVVEKMKQRLLETESLGLERITGETSAVKYEIGGDYEGRGYTMRVSGEAETMRSAFSQFSFGLLLAVVLIYLVMVVQFQSFRDPFMILATIPLGLIGVAITLWGTGTTLNIQSFMGIIMMVGIVVEYGIILLHFANDQVDEGVDVEEAIVRAAKVRVRPVLMTSITTALALMPMALGVGGSEANIPLARAIIGGVAAATVLTLIVLPCIYAIGKEPPAEAAE